MKGPFGKDDIKIAVIGGGTGSFTLLTALKKHTSRIVALVNMADNGGSTGQLRDELGVLPPGDVRQCLVALSNSPKVRDLFNYRFDEGSLKGHAFGNLFLTALEKMTGDFSEAVEVAGDVLGITGAVEPITKTDTTLVFSDSKGVETRGEFQISDVNFDGAKPQLRLDPAAQPTERALKAIEQADMIVVAPGNLYGSLAPALLTEGVGEALMKSKAFKVYVCNLVTKPGQTDGFTVQDYASEVERMAGHAFLHEVVYNTELPDSRLLERYAKSGELPVLLGEGCSSQYELRGADLLSSTIWSGSSADPIAVSRTFIRHDSERIASLLVHMYMTRLQ